MSFEKLEISRVKQTRDTQGHRICEVLGSAVEPSCHLSPGITYYSQKPLLLQKEQADVVCPSPKPAF